MYRNESGWDPPDLKSYNSRVETRPNGPALDSTYGYEMTIQQAPDREFDPSLTWAFIRVGPSSGRASLFGLTRAFHNPYRVGSEPGLRFLVRLKHILELLIRTQTMIKVGPALVYFRER